MGARGSCAAAASPSKTESTTDGDWDGRVLRRQKEAAAVLTSIAAVGRAVPVFTSCGLTEKPTRGGRGAVPFGGALRDTAISGSTESLRSPGIVTKATVSWSCRIAITSAGARPMT